MSIEQPHSIPQLLRPSLYHPFDYIIKWKNIEILRLGSPPLQAMRTQDCHRISPMAKEASSAATKATQQEHAYPCLYIYFHLFSHRQIRKQKQRFQRKHRKSLRTATINVGILTGRW